MAAESVVETASETERRTAFHLLFQDLADDDRRQRVANALGLIETGELSPEGVFVLRTSGRVIGAIVCLPVPGASALIWPPRTAAISMPEAQEDRLVQHANSWLRRRGVKLAQCLLAEDEMPLAAALERNCYRHITHLWYLRNDLTQDTAGLKADPRVRFDAYDAANRVHFEQTLLETYVNTLDCPEVTGLRTVEEIIAGHEAQGKRRHGAWSLAFVGGETVGVVMLAESATPKHWELIYIGVTPRVRGRGIGATLVKHALLQAKRCGATEVTLSVDARNTPAWRLYNRLHFTPTERREVYLASWQ